MTIKYLKRREAEKDWETERNPKCDESKLDKNYKYLRDNFVSLYENVNEETDKIGRRKDYLTDVFFGVSIYEFLQKQEFLQFLLQVFSSLGFQAFGYRLLR